MARVFCVASAKGGSGKTVLTTTFGKFLAALGKRVLLVDADAATNGLTMIHLKEVMNQGASARTAERRPRGIYERSGSVTEPEIAPIDDRLHLIPATYEFLNTEAIPVYEYEHSLSSVLSSTRQKYDYIFLDAQAGCNRFSRVAASKEMSDEVIIVTEYDPASAAGVERLKGLFREELIYSRTWLLLNKVPLEFIRSFSEFLEVVRYLSPVPWDADVVRAYARGRTALDLENVNEHTLAVMRTLKTLLGDSVSSEIDVWAKNRAAALRQPIETQYADTERELGVRLLQRQKVARTTSNGSILPSKLYLIVLMTGLLATALYLFFPSHLNVAPSPYLVAGLIIVVMAITLRIGNALFVRSRPLQMELEELRTQRQIEILEQKLKTLEALRVADLETLVRGRCPRNS